MTEDWKTIPEYQDYEASNLGRIRSKDKQRTHSVARHVSYKRKGRVLTGQENKFGYIRVGLSILDNKIKTESVHRLVASAWIPNPLNKRTVNHIDGNKANNACDNLEWSTHKENIKHAIDNNLRNPARGVQFVNRVKLDETQVKTIRSLAGELKLKDIAKYFRIHPINVSRIIKRKIWCHV